MTVLNPPNDIFLNQIYFCLFDMTMAIIGLCLVCLYIGRDGEDILWGRWKAGYRRFHSSMVRAVQGDFT